ncbi:hypothetical protein LZ198_15440 [Myxococcus sp. K15C18031901]|uniref:hypothetical protein n=1 Tax=Myxococcus dinghuensis TaxID=2906761 RepID=UPI0020A7E9AC|nr:hypothetical protein [Myxococcus dinghuensis]MCP3100263.1 hypothetical protein [Myxococcus dinghuensis]
MKTWLVVTLGAVVGFGALVPPLALAGSAEPSTEDFADPCYLQLICNNGEVLSCHGNWSCTYASDSPGSPGWINCDGAGWGCGGISW